MTAISDHKFYNCVENRLYTFHTKKKFKTIYLYIDSYNTNTLELLSQNSFLPKEETNTFQTLSFMTNEFFLLCMTF